MRVGAVAEAEAHAEFDKLLYRESRDGEIIGEIGYVVVCVHSCLICLHTLYTKNRA